MKTKKFFMFLCNKINLAALFLLISIMSVTCVYAAFNTRLQINGEAYLRAKKDIRITGIKLVEHSSGAYETYSPRYTTDTSSLYVTLPANSYVVYSITITNKSNIDYVVSKIQELTHSSSAVYTISLKVNDDVIEGIGASGVTEKTFTIKVSNNTSTTQTETLFLQYTFEEATYTASQLSYSNSATSCKNAQCAIDELARLLS